MKLLKQNFLGLVIFVLLVAGALVYASWSNTRQSKVIDAGNSEQITLGQEIYNANCALCHGETGTGYAQETIPAPALNGSMHAWHHSDDQILALIRQGGNVMPAVGKDWSDEEVEAVWAYVKQWWTLQQRKAQAGTIGE
ncbi:MAG: c-type cytochrome [Trueperaceae bacterium]|nr:c-type cytochrome [Trueperaceae bacterium]